MTEYRRVQNGAGPVRVEVIDGLAHFSDGRTAEADSLDCMVPCEPHAVICVHLNFRSRLEELAYTLPPAPTYFHKPVSCLNVHRGRVQRPANCRYLNYEGEIALVVGRTTSRITPEQASDYIAGYTVANDFGLHDFRDTDANSMLRVKGSDTLGPVGPGLVTDWDFRSKRITTAVNGKIVQDATTDDFIWDPHYLLADIARTITLLPGDLILTGTPANSRPVHPGDEVEVEVEGLGRLSNMIVETVPVPPQFGAQPSASAQVLSVALAQTGTS